MRLRFASRFVQERDGTCLLPASRGSWSFAYASGSSNSRFLVFDIAGGLVAAKVSVAMMNPVCLKHE